MFILRASKNRVKRKAAVHRCLRMLHLFQRLAQSFVRCPQPLVFGLKGWFFWFLDPIIGKVGIIAGAIIRVTCGTFWTRWPTVRNWIITRITWVLDAFLHIWAAIVIHWTLGSVKALVTTSQEMIIATSRLTFASLLCWCVDVIFKITSHIPAYTILTNKETVFDATSKVCCVSPNDLGVVTNPTGKFSHDSIRTGKIDFVVPKIDCFWACSAPS